MTDGEASCPICPIGGAASGREADLCSSGYCRVTNTSVFRGVWRSTGHCCLAVNPPVLLGRRGEATGRRIWTYSPGPDLFRMAQPVLGAVSPQPGITACRPTVIQVLEGWGALLPLLASFTTSLEVVSAPPCCLAYNCSVFDIAGACFPLGWAPARPALVGVVVVMVKGVWGVEGQPGNR